MVAKLTINQAKEKKVTIFGEILTITICFQALAVEFFKRLLDYNHGATWYHLRTLCNNTQLLEPPTREYVHLFNIVGTPYIATDKDYQSNIKLIFDKNVS